MKARLLRKILGNTTRPISNHEEYIAVGSYLCHDLFSIDKKTLKLKYALDTFREGRKCIVAKESSNGENEMLFIWDKLQELIDSGDIKDIIEGKDEIENPIAVYTIRDGKIFKSYTDVFEFYPNVDDNGFFMYENTHFKTAEEALEMGIKEFESDLKHLQNKKEELENKIHETDCRIRAKLFRVHGLKLQLEHVNTMKSLGYYKK